MSSSCSCAVAFTDEDFVRSKQHLGELQRDLRKESDAGTHHHCMTRCKMVECLLDVGGEVVEAWVMQRLDGFLCRNSGL